MTVASSTDRATFPGNGVTQIFPLPFRFFANSEIQAWLVTNATGALTALTLGTHYTLSGAGDPEVDGNPTSELTMLAAPTSLQSLFVQRVIPVTQPTDIVNQGSFFPEIHENVFDRLTMLIQQANGESKGAIRVAIGDPEPTRLPNAISRALLLMGFDSAGNPIAVAPASGSSADLALSLANDTDPAKGAGQIGRGTQVVGSIIDLRALLKTAVSKNVFVTGYYAAGDGGGGQYYLDAADTISADNGGTIIVASDGGRWKLVYQGILTIRQFGASESVSNNAAQIQAAIDFCIPLGIKLRIPRGVYPVGSPGILVDNVGAGSTGGTQSISFRTSLTGDGMGSSILDYTGPAAAYCLGIITGGSSRTEFSGFSILQKGASKIGYGIQLTESAHVEFENIAVEGFEYGVKAVDNFSISWNNCRLASNIYGLDAAFGTISRPNDFGFNNCNFIGNTTLGARFQNPTTLSFKGGSFEGNGSMVALNGGLEINGNPVDGISGLVASGVYFEGNKGDFDIAIRDNTANPGIHNINASTFNRISNVDFVSANVAFYKTNAAKTIISIHGNGFAGFNTYVANASRRYIQVPAPVDNNYVMDLGPNIWGDQIEKPVLLGARAADSRVSAAVRFNGTTATIDGVSVNVASVVRNSIGDYTISYAKALRETKNTYSVGMGEVTMLPELFSESPTVLRFKTRNAAGALTDFNNISVVVYGADGAI